MNITANESVLTQRRDSLHNEVAAIQSEVEILQALMKRAEQELTEIQTKLGELEKSNIIKLAYAG